MDTFGRELDCAGLPWWLRQILGDPLAGLATLWTMIAFTTRGQQQSMYFVEALRSADINQQGKKGGKTYAFENSSQLRVKASTKEARGVWFPWCVLGDFWIKPAREKVNIWHPEETAQPDKDIIAQRSFSVRFKVAWQVVCRDVRRPSYMRRREPISPINSPGPNVTSDAVTRQRFTPHTIPLYAVVLFETSCMCLPWHSTRRDVRPNSTASNSSTLMWYVVLASDHKPCVQEVPEASPQPLSEASEVRVKFWYTMINGSICRRDWLHPPIKILYAFRRQTFALQNRLECPERLYPLSRSKRL